MSTFSSFHRQDKLTNMENKPLDLLVIGGGITGSGIALDAVMRGMNTGLVEMQDFAAGTSSRSTKLVHGGLRYLKQMEVKMVAEVGRERAVVYENGPHVTTPEWMMLPFHKGGTFGPFTTNIGLRVYDLLAGVKKSERRKMLNKEEALAKEPLIKQDGLKGAGYYVEYKTDDARLTIEVLKKAVQKGVHAVNYAKAIDFIYDQNQQVTGAVIEDQIHGKHYKVYAKKIINAGGPWVDELREIDGSKQGKALHLTKGVHLVFSKKVFPLQQAIYFDSPDGRMIFAIPRENVTYVGTTDTSYKGDIANPTMTVADRDYILDAIHYMFPSLNITADHVESSWAGLRPLIAEEGTDNPSEISRKDEIFISDSGLISMAGGKLTGYRKMAEEAVDTVAKRLKEEDGILYSKSDTVHLPISGGEVGGSKGFAKFIVRKTDEAIAEGMDEATAKRLIHRYGANFDQILEFYRNKQQEASDEGMDRCLFAELIYAMEYESAYKPVDFFIRRTGSLFFEIDWVRAHQEKVIAYMAKELEWTEEQTEEYTNELNTAIAEAVHPQANN
ncbi:aerobic glycerol-3-phosphate dehydrogenase [Virgibacillus pantothenticus]|uniref:Glycerol-3-phosphate dehydrogenase n=1 Tax=Virgibacillus pantothenticus TaxID=1473 RepID=A0A0L0QMP6_VIRPA|nr:FAD-dependent oxidoreductase [Virgibacillus pantothenticus]KNE19789.1 glycerol-3-phosphate dehydrogenase [Virgibacillus pantothenticus]MBU8566300.1 glycerol-3-phosphate dehydrogenase/oxidase [Virgibacillus pantothenticus]MBU8600723.1 glycerol-3-phosphate dehydrogenase/oxidase [Virgibacillus pantothenticus]MBU8634569.1 glycerol-3-phosphate dehydrogenase/oxidase [Virgibacillus pantothenticus]MBU8640830.1 glycerol-3-phosphate dehydrogenase/oxidase [Virgibacillus pantothenticus]